MGIPRCATTVNLTLSRKPHLRGAPRASGIKPAAHARVQAALDVGGTSWTGECCQSRWGSIRPLGLARLIGAFVLRGARTGRPCDSYQERGLLHGRDRFAQIVPKNDQVMWSEVPLLTLCLHAHSTLEHVQASAARGGFGIER